MNFEYFHKPSSRPMPVIGLMSGSGSNLRKILEHGRDQKKSLGFSHYEMIAIFTDKPYDSNAAAISGEYGIEFLFHDDIDEFARKHGLAAKNDRGKGLDEMLRVRGLYDNITAEILENYRSDEGVLPVIALGGYMSMLTDNIIKRFLTINVHPADLRILDEDGLSRKYTGDHVVADAIYDEEKELRSSIHIARGKPDYGEILVVSAPLKVELTDEHGRKYSRDDILNYPAHLKAVADHNQERLKVAGDWKIFPLALDMIAKGTFVMDQDWKQTESGVIYRKHGDEVEQGPLILT